jgi:hypothetical protein
VPREGVRQHGGVDGLLTPTPDGAAAEWVTSRLRGSGTVASVVPTGFPAYARVLHPTSDEDGAPARWADAAAATGRTVHPLVQWEAVSTVVRDGRARPGWDGEEPDAGNLDPDVLAALLDVLAGHTATPQECWFCLWEGWGGIVGEPDQPRVQVPGRELLLFTGPLPAAARTGSRVAMDLFVPQSPNLFWPRDHAWCVGTEVDLDSTLVAGSAALVDAVLACPALEAWPVGPEDSLARDGDRVNVP